MYICIYVYMYTKYCTHSGNAGTPRASGDVLDSIQILIVSLWIWWAHGASILLGSLWNSYGFLKEPTGFLMNPEILRILRGLMSTYDSVPVTIAESIPFKNICPASHNHAFVRSLAHSFIRLFMYIFLCFFSARSRAIARQTVR